MSTTPTIPTIPNTPTTPTTPRYNQCYQIINKDGKCTKPIPIDDPETFYDKIYKNYINPDIFNLLHYLDVVPPNNMHMHRRLWFDIDYHSLNILDVQAMYKNPIINQLIVRLATVACKLFTMDEKNLFIVTVRKEINMKMYKSDVEYSYGIHVYTNMFIQGEYLNLLYNVFSYDKIIRSYMQNLGVAFTEFVDRSVIANPHKNNGCMFIGCSKDDTPSTYKLYQVYQPVGEWYPIPQEYNSENEKEIKLYVRTTFLNKMTALDYAVEPVNKDLIKQILKNRHGSKYYNRLAEATKQDILNAVDIKDIKGKDVDIPEDFIKNVNIQFLEKCYKALASISSGDLFVVHDTWFKICAATKQLYNQPEAYNLFYQYSMIYKHTQTEDYIKKTWDNMRCNDRYENNYILVTLMKHDLLPPEDKNDYIYLSLINCYKIRDIIDIKTIIDLFQLYDFQDIYAVYSSITDYKLYHYDEKNVLRRIENENDNQFFETRLTMFLLSMNQSFFNSKLCVKESEFNQKIAKKIKIAINPTINNFKEWKSRYLTDYGIPYHIFNKKYMVHKEKHVYTQLGFIVPEDPNASPKALGSMHYQLIPYTKSDMVFEDMIIAAKYIPDWNNNEEGKKAVELFDTHINRYCEYSFNYANIMKKILTSAFYTKSDSNLAYILYGTTGANGKTVTTDLLASIIGDKQCIVVNPDNLDENSVSPKLVDMSNKLMYYMNELVDEDPSGKKRTYNPFNSRIFKEIAEKKKGVSARRLFSNVYNDINYTGTLFITSNVQPTAINASPIARRVCFLPSCCRFFPEGSEHLYEYKINYNSSLKKQVFDKVLKPNHYEMDPTIKYTFEKYKDYIFSYLVQTYLFESTLLTASILEEEEHIASCKAKFFARSAESYEINEFVHHHICIDPYQINIVSLEEIFNLYKHYNRSNPFTIKKDIEKFSNALFGCLTSDPEFAHIDIVNIDRSYTNPFYINTSMRGIKGIILDFKYKSDINMLDFCTKNNIRYEENTCTTPEEPNRPKRRMLIDGLYSYYFP